MNRPHRAAPRTQTQSLTVLLLACGFGIVFLARNALGNLSPFLVADFNLQNESLGLLAASYSFAWAVSGIVLTAVTRTLKHRLVLTALMITLAVASVASSLASSFHALFLARLASGIASGPVMPLMQSYAAGIGSRTHRGLRMGVVQGVGTTVFGGVLAPLILVPVAVQWGWRIAFLPVAAMGLISALLLWAVLPAQFAQGAQPAAESEPARPRIGSVRINTLLCSLIGGVMVGWLVVSLTFYPLYFMKIQHRLPGEMSELMSLMGASSLIAAILVPHLSDRFGSRRVLITFTLIGVLGPLGILTQYNSPTVLTVSAFVGSLAGGTFPLFLAIIPADSADPRSMPTVMGMGQGTSEIAGGMVLPIVAGWAADRYGLQAPLLTTLVCTLLASLFAMALPRAPRRMPPMNTHPPDVT